MFARFKIYIIFGLIVLLLIGTISGLGYWLKLEIDNGNRQGQNVKVLQTNLKTFKDKSGADAVTIQELQMTKGELQGTNDSTLQALLRANKELGNKDKHIEQLLSVKTKVIYKNVEIPIHDTLIVYKNDTLTRVSTISTKWVDATIGVMPDKLILLNHESRDEVVIVLKWYKTGTWFFPRWFERKKYAADIKSLNPDSKITQAQNVKVTGKRGR